MHTPAQKHASSLDPKTVERIIAEVREEEIVAMCCDVINIPSPTGHELQMAQYMQGVVGLYDHGNFDAPPQNLISAPGTVSQPTPSKGK